MLNLELKNFFKSAAAQLNIEVNDEQMKKIGAKCRFGFWERLDENRCVVRFATSFATTKNDVEQLAEII